MSNNQNTTAIAAMTSTEKELYDFITNKIGISLTSAEKCISRCKDLGFNVEQMSYIYRTNAPYKVMEYFYDIYSFIPGKTPEEIYENDFSSSGQYLLNTKVSALGWNRRFMKKNNMLHEISGGTVLMHPWWWED